MADIRPAGDDPVSPGSVPIVTKHSVPGLKVSPTQRKAEWFVVRCAVLSLVASAILCVLVLLAWRLRVTLLLILIGVFIAALLQPFVSFFTRRGMRRGYAVGFVYLWLLVVAGGFGYLFFEPLVHSAIHYVDHLPRLISQARRGKGLIGRVAVDLHLQHWVQSNLPNAQTALKKIEKPAFSIGKSVVSGVVGAVTIAFVSFFVLLEGPRSLQAALSWIDPAQAARINRITRAMGREVVGFMIGDFATSVIAGLVIFCALEITGVPYAAVLAVWVGLVDFLPLVGGLLAGVPTVAVAFLHSVPAGVVAIVVFIVYQEVENHVLYPIIVSRTVRLSPLWVLLAVLVGAETGNIVGSTFGAIVGAILAVPVAGSLQIAFRELVVERRREKIASLEIEVAGDAPASNLTQ